MPGALTLYEGGEWGRPGFGIGQGVVTPPAASKMLLGTTEWSEKYDNDAIQPLLYTYNANAKLAIIRRYADFGEWIPNNFTTSHGSEDIGQNRASWVSYSDPSIAKILDGSFDATLSAYFASIPANHKVMFTYMHEVNNDKLGAGETPQLFAQATAHIWDIKNASAQNSENVKVGPILIPADFRSGTHKPYFPTNGKYDFIGIDPYRFARDVNDPSYIPDPKTGTAGTPRTMEYIIGQAPAFSISEGKPLAFGEYGAHTWSSKPTERTRWLLETDNFMSKLNVMAAIYFHSSRGQSGPWLIDRWHVYDSNENSAARRSGATDASSLQTFADLLAKYKP